MKKVVLILFCVSMSYFLMAQEPVKQKEIGLVFSNLDNFGFTYRVGTDKSLWRFNTLFLGGNNSESVTDSLVDSQNSTGFGLRVGREYRKEIVENLEFRYGADLSFSYSHLKSERNDKTGWDNDYSYERTIYTPGINLVLGLNYVLSDKLVIGAEILPYFSYKSGTTTAKYTNPNNINDNETDISGFNYGLSNTSVFLSVAYRIR